MPSFAFPRRRNSIDPPPADAPLEAPAVGPPAGQADQAAAGADPADTSRPLASFFAEAVLVVLERPGLVALGLAGFLVRGGILVLLLPIVVLPTPVGLATILGPDIVSVALAGPNPGLIRLAAIGSLVVLCWLVVSGILGAAVDVAVTAAAGGAAKRRAALGPGAVGGDVRPIGIASGAVASGGSVGGDRWRLVARVAAVRWLAQLPLVAALAWGAFRIVEATYAELVLPSDTVTPLILRVLAAAPDALVLVVGVWLAGEVWGGVAARFVVLGGRSVIGALGAGLRWFARTPIRGLVTTVATTLVLALGLGAAIGGSAAVWASLRPIVRIDPGGVGMVSAVLLLVAVWLTAVVAVGLLVTWRAVLWTLVVDVGRAGSGPRGRAPSVPAAE